MHEFSLAIQIADNVLDFLSMHERSEVVKVRVLIGDLTGIEPVQLQFCYNAITRENVLRYSSLDIERVAPLIHCSFCKFSGSPKYRRDGIAVGVTPKIQCPRCGKVAQPVRGQECEIKSVQIAQRELAAALAC